LQKPEEFSGEVSPRDEKASPGKPPFPEDDDRFPIRAVGSDFYKFTDDSLSEISLKKAREEFFDKGSRIVEKEKKDSDQSRSIPVVVPKTVPLYLESTNDVLPGSPSLKYLQISPENSEKSFTFPEVTFSNIIALKTKSLGKNGQEEFSDKGKREDRESCPKSKGSENFAGPEKTKRPSKAADEVLSSRSRPFHTGDENWSRFEFPERSGVKISSAAVSKIFASDAVVDQSELFEKIEEDPYPDKGLKILDGKKNVSNARGKRSNNKSVRDEEEIQACYYKRNHAKKTVTG
jgi:hypothetical protein